MAEQQSAVIDWVDPKLLKPHKVSLQIYGEDSCEDLVESVRELGVLQPLYVTPKGVIISGHRRWRAADLAGKQVPVIRKSYPRPLDEQQAIIEFNRYRIKTGQQLYNEGKALEEILTRKRGRPKREEKVENFPPFEKTRDAIAEAIGLGSGKQWDKLEYVAEHSPELLTEIKPDGISITRAYTEARKDEKQAAIKPEPELPEGVFQVFYMDPPWKYDNSGLGGSAESHYRTRTVDEMLAKLRELDFASRVAPDCVLFLWATNPLLPDALRLIDALGFEYKTNLAWVKNKPTYGKLGFYVYGQHELLLIATQGSMLPKGEKPASVIYADVRDHSRKPAEAYKIIDQMYPNARKCELFGRKKPEGWEVWGDQVSEEIT